MHNKTTREMIKVMEAHDRGEVIEWREGVYEDWEQVNSPSWNWCRFDYRVKPKPKQRLPKPKQRLPKLEELVGQLVKPKREPKGVYMITAAYEDQCWFGYTDSRPIRIAALCDLYTKPDGSSLMVDDIDE